ncbi:MAG TPA: DUF167 domain-containing protein [Pyrinomonadaceae bacterium]
MHSIHDGRLIFKVQVVPRSSRSEVVGEHDGSLRVRVSAAPVEGAANKELTQVLAKAFKVSRSAVSIVSGQNSRLKQVSIEGVSSSTLSALAKS